MAYSWFNFDDCHVIEGYQVTEPNGKTWGSDWESWRFGYVIGANWDDDKGKNGGLRVDALPALYQLLAANADFATRGSFEVRIGDEDLILRGTPANNLV